LNGKKVDDGAAALKRRFFSLFCLATAFILAGGALYYRSYRGLLAENAEAFLSSVHQYKQDQLAFWRQERLNDVGSLLDSPLLSVYLERYAAGPGDRELAALLKKRFESFIKHNNYHAALLTDASGRIYLNAGEHEDSPCPEVKNIIARTAAGGGAEMGDIVFEAGDKKPHLDIAARATGGRGGRALYLVLRADPEDYLYPLLKKWPAPSKTGETLLVRAEGGQVLYLNELRYQPGSAARLRLPLSAKELPAAMALSGAAGLVSGRDYRGRPVLAYVGRVPGTGWSLVAQMDKAELFAGAGRVTVLLLLLMLALVAVTGAAAFFMLKLQTEGLFKKLAAKEAESEEYRIGFEALADQANESMVVTDQKAWRMVNVNRKACETYGYTREEMLKLKPEDLVAPGRLAVFNERFKGVAGGEGLVYESENRRKDGTLFPVEVSASCVEFGSRKYVYFICRDITERKKAEEALRLSQQRRALYFEQTPLAVIEFSLDGKISEWNPAAADIFGYARSEALGRHWNFIVPREVWPYLDGVWEAIIKQHGGSRASNKNLTKDGRLVECEWFNTPLVDASGKTIAVSSLIMDVTERKQAEEKLRESERRLAALIANLPGIAYRCRNDAQWSMDFISEGCLKMTGYAPEELTGNRVLSFGDLIIPEDRDPVWNTVQDALEKKTQFQLSFRLRRKDGELRSAFWQGAGVRDEKGGLLGLEGLITDITDIKKAEEKIGLQDELLRLTGDMAKIGGWEFDPVTGSGTWTPELWKIHDLDPDRSVDVKSSLSFYTPESRARMENAIKAAVESARPYELELELVSAKGRRKWVRSVGNPVVVNGKVVKVQGTFQDISEQKAAAEILRITEERFRQLFETMEEGFATHEVILDDKGVPVDYRFLDVNPAFERLTGLHKKEIQGRRVLEVLPATEKAWIEKYGRVALTGQTLHMQDYSATLDRWYEVSAFRPRPGQFAVSFLDITERKKAEEEKVKLLERLNLATSAANIGIWDWDIPNNTLLWDDRMYELYRIRKEDFAGAYEAWMSTVHPKDRAKTGALIKNVLAGATDYDVEFRAVWPDGQVRVIKAKGLLMRDAAGRPRRMIGVNQDITAQRKADELIRENETIFSAFLEHSPVYIFFKDREMRSLRLSRNYEKMLGMPLEKALGKSMDELFPSELSRSMVADDQRVLQEGKVVIVREELNGKSYETTKFPVLKDGKPNMLAGFTVDITARKQAEAALYESEKAVRRKLDAILSPETDISALELSDIIDSEKIQKLMDKFYRLTGIGIGILDLQGRVLVGTGWQEICTKFHRINPEACRLCVESDLELSRDVPPGTFKQYKCKNNMWDMSTPIMLGKTHVGNIFLGQFLYDDEIPDKEVFLQQARRYGFDERAYLEALDQVPRWSRKTVEAAMSFYAAFAEMIGHLSYSNIKLANALEERKRAQHALEKSENGLRAKNLELEDFIYIASHDLRTPLVNIQGFSENIARNCAELWSSLETPGAPVPGAARARELLATAIPEGLKFIASGVNRMDALVTALLKVARLGRLELKPELVDMDKLMADLLKGMAFQLKALGAQVHLGKLPPCAGDPERLAQVFANILDNAVKYSDPKRKLVIRISGARPAAGTVSYTVVDNGQGLAPEEAREKVWKLLYRAKPRGAVPGEGIGLTISKRIVEKHGGCIKAAPVPGGGAAFTVDLPVMGEGGAAVC